MKEPSYLDNITAREIMTPGVVAIVEDASLKQAFNAMAAHAVHAVLILGRDQGI
jgi:CBS domain-containing protein